MKKYINLILVTIIAVTLLSGCATTTQSEKSAKTEIDNETNKDIDYFDVDYTTNEDGTYTCRGNIYKYKIEVYKNEGDVDGALFAILTNDKNTTFDEVENSLISATMDTGVPKFIIIGCG